LLSRRENATDIAGRDNVFFVIPAGVMRELDGLKRNPEKWERAVEATKQIEELIKMKKARIETQKSRYFNALASKVDEEVVATAVDMRKEGKVILFSIDHAQRALALQEGIEVSDRLDDYLNNRSLEKVLALQEKIDTYLGIKVKSDNKMTNRTKIDSKDVSNFWKMFAITFFLSSFLGVIAFLIAFVLVVGRGW
jgi:rRNA-processing protein FCF1